MYVIIFLHGPRDGSDNFLQIWPDSLTNLVRDLFRTTQGSLITDRMKSNELVRLWFLEKWQVDRGSLHIHDLKILN